MKMCIILGFTLFSFITSTMYSAQDYDCRNNQIRIFYKGNWFDLSLFNIHIHEDANICSYVNGEITFEFEEVVEVKEPYSAYVFVDEELLQNILVEDKKASVLNNSPAYKYQIKEESKAVLSENVEIKEDKIVIQRFFAYGIIFLYVVICITLFLQYHPLQKDINKIKNDV